MTAPFRLLDQWAPQFRAAERLKPSVWCERNLILPASTARPGPLKLLRFQAAALDLIFDDAVRTACLLTGAQLGKTTILSSAMAYTMAGDPGPSLLLHSTDAAAKSFVRSKLNPLIQSSPALRDIIGGGQGGAGDSVSFKEYPSGHLQIASSFDVSTLAANSVRYLFGDELDRWALVAGSEGDPWILATKRQFSFESIAKSIVASTPTTATSRIGAMFRRGDQRRWFVPCPACGTFDFFKIANLHWPKGAPHKAFLTCESCPEHIDETARKIAVEHPEAAWMPTEKPEQNGLISFHATELISVFSSLERVAAQHEEMNAREFANTVAGESYDDADRFEVSADELLQRAVPIQAPYDSSIQAISIGVDVQRDRVEATVLATLPGRLAVLAHHVFNGDTTGPAPWLELDKLFGSVFPLQDGRRLPMSIAGVDAGFQQDIVIDFVRAQRGKGRNVLATKGQKNAGAPIIRMSPTRLAGGIKLALIGTHDGKKHLLERLKISDPSAPGHIAIPLAAGEEYAAGLAAERLESTLNRRGYANEQWVRVERRNEPLDCLLIAFAVMRHPSARTPRSDAPKQSLAESMAKLNAGQAAPQPSTPTPTNPRPTAAPKRSIAESMARLNGHHSGA